ncbi:MAG: hypothetical protein Q4F07_06325, partial [Bacteroidales bacterium]|nr:hypothetical protein [Bacteroidales bacterium]
MELIVGGGVECLQGCGAVFAAEPAAVGADDGCLEALVVDAEPDHVAVEEGLEAGFKDGGVEDEQYGAAAEALALEGVYDVEVQAVREPMGVYRAVTVPGPMGVIPGGFAAGEPQPEGACAGQGGEA